VASQLSPLKLVPPPAPARPEPPAASLFSQYALDGAYDEMFDVDWRTRPHYRALIEELLVASPEELRQLARRKEEYYREEVAGHVQPLPGVRDILRSLHQAGFSQAIASSAPPKNIGLVLESTGIGEYFDAIVSGDEVSAGKPDPEIFLEAARRLGAAPSRCVVIEDAIAGVEAAVAARMRCIAVTNTNPSEKLSQADLVVKSLEELSADVLENLLQ